MITRITSIEELKQIFLEIFLNKTDKVSDVSDDSVLNGIAYGCAKLAQRTLTNQAIIEGHIFPETSYGGYLDKLAEIRGTSPRFGATQSATFVRVVADSGTIYSDIKNEFISTSGVKFRLDGSNSTVTVGDSGFAYIKVFSVSSGLLTNVDSLTINKVLPVPTGHISCTNEFAAIGGRDFEDDELFRQRIKENINQLSRSTLSYLEQIFIKINNNVLRIFKGGIDTLGRLNIIVCSVNGKTFSENEFDNIMSRAEEFLSLSDLLNASTDYSLRLVNVTWLPVDINFRIDIDPSFDKDEVRKNIQIQISKLFDYRFWKYGDKVEWENMLFAAKNVEGVRYIPDTHFYPHTDIIVPKYQLPCVRSFILRDLEGNIFLDKKDVLNDYYYPNDIDDNFSSTVLTTI